MIIYWRVWRRINIVRSRSWFSHRIPVSKFEMEDFKDPPQLRRKGFNIGEEQQHSVPMIIEVAVVDRLTILPRRKVVVGTGLTSTASHITVQGHHDPEIDRCKWAAHGISPTDMYLVDFMPSFSYISHMSGFGSWERFKKLRTWWCGVPHGALKLAGYNTGHVDTESHRWFSPSNLITLDILCVLDPVTEQHEIVNAKDDLVKPIQIQGVHLDSSSLSRKGSCRVPCTLCIQHNTI